MRISLKKIWFFYIRSRKIYGLIFPRRKFTSSGSPLLRRSLITVLQFLGDRTVNWLFNTVSGAIVPVEHVSAQLGHAAIWVAKDETFGEGLFFDNSFSKQAVQCFEPGAH